MIRHLVAGMKHALGLHRPGRWLPVRPDDILLASYPKSGNTWLRFLIANLIHPDREVGLGNLHQLVLDPEVSVKRDFDRAPRPRFIKSHGSFDPRYRRVIYVVGDPRDVALSQYQCLRQLGKIDDESPLADFIERFLAGADAASRVSTHNSGSWGDNTGSWLAARSGHPGFLLLRNEDLLADTAHELTRVAEFGGLAAAPARILQAVERSSANASARSSWRNDLPAPQVARIEAAWGDIMACLGYELVTRDSCVALKSSLIGLLAAGAAAGTGEQREEAIAGDTLAKGTTMR
ncbi:MAG: sulfotransferase domain-containing protein [Terriglobales bacterium]